MISKQMQCVLIIFTFSISTLLAQGFNPPPAKNAPKSEWDAWIAQKDARLRKALGDHSARKEGTHNGNQIVTLFYNYGSIGKPNTEPSLVWPKGTNHGYGFEFGILVGSEVFDINRVRRHIISEGLYTGGDESNQGAPWGWEPKNGYANPDQDYIAMNDNQDTWPERWARRGPNAAGIFDGSWWGEYGVGVATADQESYFVMDDSANAEFKYYPFGIENTDRMGLGMDVEVRGYQWAHVLAQDCIFWVYDITHVGVDTLDKVYLGMYGDPHIGGADDYSDDDGFYTTKLDMVYGWDHDFRGSPGSFRPGYLGYKFLESPGEPYDNKDNDEDGLIDESMQNDTDDDSDWNPLTDDVGADGVSADFNENGVQDGLEIWDRGEGDGVPTHGEPNFDETDLDEADQIGLTAFSVFEYATIYASQDEDIWKKMVSGIVDSLFDQTKDNIFMYSSGPIKMGPNDSRRFSIALLFGYDKDDLFRNANTVQDIYNSGYRFAQAPLKPELTAVPGDGKVTLYWDSRSEESRDPVHGKDFEGYSIYRGTDVGLRDAFVITDTHGNPKMWKPLARFDLKDGIKGPHPIESVSGIHFYTGDDTGLQHSFVDTTVINGQRYFYAVVSYDRGDSVKFPPTECSMTFVEDPPNSGNFLPGINTAIVTPQAPAAGYEPPSLFGGSQPFHNEDGPGTGQVRVEFLDPTQIKDKHQYEISFDDTTYDHTVFSLVDVDLIESDTTVVLVRWKYTEYDTTQVPPLPIDSVRVTDIQLSYGNLIAGSVVVGDVDGRQYNEDQDYAIDYAGGRITVLDTLAMPIDRHYIVDYRRFLIHESSYLDGSDRNPYVHGLKVLIKDDPLQPDSTRSGFISGNCNYRTFVQRYPSGGVAYPADYVIELFDEYKSTSFNRKPCRFTVYNLTDKDSSKFVFFDVNGDSTIGEQDKVIPMTQNQTGRWIGTWQIRFELPADSIIYSFGQEVGRVPIQPIHPKAGDKILIASKKPFDYRDLFTFETRRGYVHKERAVSELDRIAVVPNPYVAASEYEIKPNIQSGRGNRLLYFIHLPSKCTIRIYTLAGDLVQTLEHDSPVEDGSEGWDLLSKDQMEIAYGVYIYHIDAPDVGEHIGKFAVIK